MNATCLFSLPRKKFHNSESFWSSLFAIQIVDTFRQGIKLHIPTFVYHEDGKRWLFELQKDNLELPSQLDFKSIVVEGKLGIDFFPGISDSLHKKFENLRPDITIFGNNSLTFIETKTVGAGIAPKEQLYFELCEEFTKSRRINANTYLLLSAGHENAAQVRGLATSVWKRPPRLILWEQFFKAVERQVKNSLLSRLFPNLSQYYELEESYLSGNF